MLIGVFGRSRTDHGVPFLLPIMVFAAAEVDVAYRRCRTSANVFYSMTGLTAGLHVQGMLVQ